MMMHVIFIIAFVVIYNIYRYYREQKDIDYCPVIDTVSSNNQVEETTMEETISTRQLALKTIENIGSTPQYTEEGRIQLEYQGITFLIEATNDCALVNLIWPWCHKYLNWKII